MIVLRFIAGLAKVLGSAMWHRIVQARNYLANHWFRLKIMWYQHGHGWEYVDAKRLAQGKLPRSGVVRDYTATQTASWDSPELENEIRMTKVSAAVFQETIGKIERGEELDNVDRSVIRGLNKTLQGG